MSNNTLVKKRGRDRFDVAAINQLKTALLQDVFSRAKTGAPADRPGSIGTSDYRYLLGYVRKLILGGDTTQITIEESSGALKFLFDGVEFFRLTSAYKTTGSSGSDPGVNGFSKSSSSGSYTTTSATYVDVTNLSTTLTTIGGEVWVQLIPDGSANFSQLSVHGATGAARTATIAIVRGSTTIAEYTIGVGTTVGGSTQKTCGAVGGIWFPDLPAAGTYTYKVQAKAGSGATLTLSNCQLFAFERQ